MNKVFLYDPDSVTRDTIRIMRAKGYRLIELTRNPDFFWNTIEELSGGSTLVLLSHGDKYGPLAVAGTTGDDIDLEVFARLISRKSITLYLLSCHTGNDPCAMKLTERSLNYVAPRGMAVFQTIGSETVAVVSRDGNYFPGWAGPLGPSRASKQLFLP